ncbi:hypothetical protein [Phenylobacterium sp.]|uniref:hypothetical protein n=1 Tax=Phenylobacterium sp. TaxID=1871053 RepID=UPI0035B273FE
MSGDVAPDVYDYLFLTFAVDASRAAPRAFAERLAGPHRRALEAAGGELVGYFTPQLGWSSDEAALILRWPADAPGRKAAVDGLCADPALAGARRDRMAATIRPGPADLPPPGGIFVHRVFEIDAADVDMFVALSGQAWGGFEGGFDSDIFGLFRVSPTAEDARAGGTRMLLVTRYADHGVWEASRAPAPEVRDLFMRRRDLTRRTVAASTLLAPL